MHEHLDPEACSTYGTWQLQHQWNFHTTVPIISHLNPIKTVDKKVLAVVYEYPGLSAHDPTHKSDPQRKPS